ALLWAGLLWAGCVSQYKVVVDFSPELRGYFTEYPTLEVDIAAVTDGEAGEVKQAGVEKYFAPDSGFRERLQSQTCFFSREDAARFVLPSRAQIWQDWRIKEPTNILVIASLPHDSSMSPEADPRQLVVKMKNSYVFARTLYVLVEPKKVIQISRSRAESQSEDAQSYEQWVETR
ncbi:MAG: hypothetical protein LBU19_06855, partial [Treponema sp.]|nr:hypothetical protein [Treponema sp.]